MARGAANGSFMEYHPASRTITGLKRWSSINKDLPGPSQVRAIHVYDFDNTLFSSPLPNPQLWSGPSIGFLQAYESFANGGWWHDPTLLSATGDGIEKEEPRAWKGWWNERIAQLVELSMKQKDALTVLLTGRSEAGFSELIKRMVDSKKLEFDLVCLKPEVGPNGERFSSTMDFKQTFLEDIVLTYEQADEIRVYEDRPKHVKGFRDFFEKLNRSYQMNGSDIRKPLTAEVIQVAEETMYLPPVIEAAEVQRMINSHNVATRDPALNVSKSPYGRLCIRRTTYFTGYLIPNSDSDQLIRRILNPLVPSGLAESNDLKYMANSILIAPRPATRSILDKVGGLGKKLSWIVTGTGVFENKVWAARLQPVPDTERYHTENRVPFVVLAVRKGARPIDAQKIHNWHPIPSDNALKIESVVGEKVVLRIEEENASDYDNRFMNKTSKRRHQQERDEDILYPPQSAPEGPQGRQPHGWPRHGNNNRNQHDDGPRRGGFRGRGRGAGPRGRGYSHANRGGGRGRGRGHNAGPAGYRSLDDHSGYEGGGGGGGSGGGGYEDKSAMNY